MFLFFQPLSKQKLLPFKAQKLPEGGFQLCVAAQFTYAAGDNKSLSVNNKGSLQWHVKLEICVLTVWNTVPSERVPKRQVHPSLPTLSSSTILREKPN